MLKKRRWVKRTIKIGAAAILILAVLLYIVWPVAFGFVATRRYSGNVGSPPEGFQSITLKTDDQVKLQGWYAAPKNGSVILLVHGATASRKAVRGYAEMFVKNGYGVLAYDMRGHGESGGRGNAYGWNGIHDVGAAVDFLTKQADVRNIGGLGLSMGGETLLGAASQYPAIRAVVSDGATYRSTGDYLILSSRKSLIRSWSTRVMFASVGFFTGQKPPVTILDSVSKAEKTQFLFIAAGNIKKEEEYNARFAEATKGRSQMWLVPGAGHTGAFHLYPEEYEKKVVDFFSASLK